MEDIKSNQATENRPEGDRIIDAPYVFIDTQNFIDQLKHERSWEKNDRNGITVFKSEKLAIVITALRANAFVQDYAVNGFLTIQVLEGQVDVKTNDKNLSLTAGQSIVFHPHLSHSILSVSDAVIMQTTVHQ